MANGFGGQATINGVYDWVTFTLNTGTTDYDVKANQANLFLNIPNATKQFIWSNQNISFKFNRTGNPAIILDVGNGESPFEGKDIFTATNIYLTNSSGSTATIKILLGV